MFYSHALEPQRKFLYTARGIGTPWLYLMKVPRRCALEMLGDVALCSESMLGAFGRTHEPDVPRGSSTFNIDS